MQVSLWKERASIKLSIPKSEEEFQTLRDTIYAVTKAAIAERKQPKFQGIIEVARSNEDKLLSLGYKQKQIKKILSFREKLVK